MGLDKELREIVNNLDLESVTADIMEGATDSEIGIIASSAVHTQIKAIIADESLTYDEIIAALHVVLAYTEIVARSFPTDAYEPAAERMKLINNLVEMVFE